jgi:hypothetical protein
MESDIDVKEKPAEAEAKVPLKIKKGDYQVHIFLEEARGLLGEEER